MAKPVAVDIPHTLGREGARQRIAGGVDKIGSLFPGGVTSGERWDGDTLHFTVTAMGQSVSTSLEVGDTHVHAVVELPMMLSLFSGQVRDILEREAPKLLR
ncbi:putative polyhydroxyalkanoate system protein [Sphingomonas sp. BE123]|jgi:putative polyhydroxyalkanoate system protein|uniref:polyhydroxyalkanoic acid system family protein n=1 Tax=unclassified Sphingomonas TaxID=196159 RepID=UPI0028672903|nr:polyhydroxyalkanoic acid system family protein [Sphingomonas sp. BE123]MDR6852121.1 putative polyhydroxyalkanoate system protein [Sphingomonas sp. BE123]